MSPRQKLDRICGAGPARVIWLSLASDEVAEIAAMQGPGACVIDAEHGRIGTEMLTRMIRAVELCGQPKLVRLGEISDAGMKHALDAGADGVILPRIETPEAAEEAARAFYFPPRGRRGNATGIIRASAYGMDTGYAAEWAERGMLILQIESPVGLAAAGEIAAVEGVDMLFFGPFDYAQSAGLDPVADGARLAEAAGRMRDAAAAQGRLSDTFPWPGVTTEALLTQGFDMLAVASDSVVLRQGLAEAVGRT